MVKHEEVKSEGLLKEAHLENSAVSLFLSRSSRRQVGVGFSLTVFSIPATKSIGRMAFVVVRELANCC